MIDEDIMRNTEGIQEDHEKFGLRAQHSEDNSHKVISENLKIVSLICNVFTISMCIYLMHNLYADIKSSKSNSQKRKIRLLKWSMLFICCFFANDLILVFVPFLPEMYPTADLLM